MRTGLLRPMLLAGVEPRLFLLNVGVMTVMLVLLNAWYWIILAWMLHQALKALTRSDPAARHIYIRYQQQADHYEPWPESRPRSGLRPQGAGRGRL